MKGASVKKVILRFSSGNDPICHSQKFQPSQTPPSHFLPISPRFLTNIRCQYFSLNICVVYDQLEFDWCIFDQNWAKTRPLHFQIFQIPNAIDRPIVHWESLTVNTVYYTSDKLPNVSLYNRRWVHTYIYFCSGWYRQYFPIFPTWPWCVFGNFIDMSKLKKTNMIPKCIYRQLLPKQCS